MRSNEEFARYIDATLLKPNVTQEDMRQHLEAARRFHFKTVAIGCAWIPYAKELLAESDVGIDAPIGFPNGYSTTESKVFETIDAFAKGATEADILINIGWLRSGRYAELEDELKRFVAAAGGKVTKVILENYYLTDEQKREGVRIVKRAGADFVKTSTGFAAAARRWTMSGSWCRRRGIPCRSKHPAVSVPGSLPSSFWISGPRVWARAIRIC